MVGNDASILRYTVYLHLRSTNVLVSLFYMILFNVHFVRIEPIGQWSTKDPLQDPLNGF